MGRLSAIVSRERNGVWDEALRQGEAVLDRQLQVKTEALRGAESLLRLSVATLAGIIAVAGLVVTVGPSGSPFWLAGLGTAAFSAALAALCHAAPFAGPFRASDMVLGPDFDVIVDALGEGGSTHEMLVESTVRSLAGWFDANNVVIAHIERWKARGLALLALAGLILLGTFVYIQGGRIFA